MRTRRWSLMHRRWWHVAGVDDWPGVERALRRAPAADDGDVDADVVVDVDVGAAVNVAVEALGMSEVVVAVVLVDRSFPEMHRVASC